MDKWQKNETGKLPAKVKDLKAVRDFYGIIWTREPDHLTRFPTNTVYCVNDHTFRVAVQSGNWAFDKFNSANIQEYMVYTDGEVRRARKERAEQTITKAVKSVFITMLVSAALMVIASMGVTVYILTHADKIIG